VISAGALGGEATGTAERLGEPVSPPRHRPRRGAPPTGHPARRLGLAAAAGEHLPSPVAAVTKARTYQVHSELVLVELRDVYLTVERTLLQRGQQNTVRQTRLTFQQAMYREFIGAIEGIVGRQVKSYESVVIACPEVVIELFYLESPQEREERVAREAREDAGEIPRPEAGIPQ
jgi:uncharacterized protein YbcI